MFSKIVRRLSAVGFAVLMLIGMTIALPSAAQALSLSTFQQTSNVWVAEVAAVTEAAPVVEDAEEAAEKEAEEAEEIGRAHV